MLESAKSYSQLLVVNLKILNIFIFIILSMKSYGKTIEEDMQNKSHLMDELTKVVRVMRKQDETVPHETLVVLDTGTGQNAVSQAIEFDQAVGVTGVAVTKLDGTARGGVLFAIAHKLKRPIRFIGVGEQPEDLRDFVARDFVDALFDER